MLNVSADGDTSCILPFPQTRPTNQLLKSRNLTTAAGRTSVRLEGQLWTAYDDICAELRITRNQLSQRIHESRPDGIGFTAAIRVFLVGYFWARANDPGADEHVAMKGALTAVARGSLPAFTLQAGR